MSSCRECSALLAHDQRYCIECGARRGPLPGFVTGAAPFPEAAERSRAGFSLPSPRVAAVAVMSLLAFGVVLGTAVSPAEQSAATVVVDVPPPAPAPTVAATTPEPSTPAPASSAPALASAPAAAPAPTSAPAPAPAAPQQQSSTPAPAPAPAPGPPAVKHLFLIVLNDHSYDEAFGPKSQAPYLAGTLTKQGELVTNYYAVAGSSLANQVALISGQGPTPETTANCPQYTDVTPGTIGSDGQVAGAGCVYPVQALTLADQLTAAKKDWKAYVEDVGSGQPGEATTCRHPAIGVADTEQSPRPNDAYVTWRNPFVYFHSLTDGDACNTNDVGLDQLAFDLQKGKKAPAFSYIVPNRCHDGAEEPCAPGAPAGLPAADTWLKTIVPEIEKSAAYKDGGMIAITFDEAPQTGPDADPSACCDNPTQYPNLAATVPPTGTTGPTGPDTTGGNTTPTGGGGHVGLLLISSFVQAGTQNTLDYYNHYSLLKSIEDLFSLDHLGYAADPALPVFDQTVYNAPAKSGN